MNENPVRAHRVRVFCDWLLSIPPDQSFEERPEYPFFDDLTEVELCAAELILARHYAALAHAQDFSAPSLTAREFGLTDASNDP